MFKAIVHFSIQKKLFVGLTTLFLLLGGIYAMMTCLLYTSPSPRDGATSRMPSSA